MYEDLVKRLRESDEKSQCGECGLNLHTGATKKGVLFAEAADAIKELSGRDTNVPRWIPVTERLPENDRQVLAYYGFDHGDGYLGMMFVQVLDWFGHDPKPHFQHEGLNGMTVTHWMPLPEPPKEEEQ